jgi:hypothetical protein
MEYEIFRDTLPQNPCDLIQQKRGRTIVQGITFNPQRRNNVEDVSVQRPSHSFFMNYMVVYTSTSISIPSTFCHKGRWEPYPILSNPPPFLQLGRSSANRNVAKTSHVVLDSFNNKGQPFYYISNSVMKLGYPSLAKK